MPTDPEVKTCPDCAEQISAAAAKCRFCGYRFPTRLSDVDFARLEAKVERGSLLNDAEQSALAGEITVSMNAQKPGLKLLIDASNAEATKLGRKLTGAEERDFFGRDPSLSETNRGVDEKQRSLDRAFALSEASHGHTMRALRQREAELLRANPALARLPRQPSNAGLFLVSPLAWAIKKTWNGKRR